ncbi:MAG: DUF1643 domain-containing protein [Kiritimatiellae bacterium]|nr:DUF1643 domain-containing protein [Kiritimatiellia bacterium]
MDETGNICAFSPDRKYRYTLLHRWGGLFPTAPRTIAWIALNPSTADENQLDPTLRRIRGYSAAWGYDSFMMLNAFAYRATDPREMERADDPVGPENDAYLLAETAKVDKVICAWGTHASLANRQDRLLALLKDRPLFYLKLTKDGFPSHPLYLKRDLVPVRWIPSETAQAT